TCGYFGPVLSRPACYRDSQDHGVSRESGREGSPPSATPRGWTSMWWHPPSSLPRPARIRLSRSNPCVATPESTTTRHRQPEVEDTPAGSRQNQVGTYGLYLISG